MRRQPRSSTDPPAHAYLFEAEQDTEEEEPEMGMYFSVGALLGITVVTSFCADCASTLTRVV